MVSADDVSLYLPEQKPVLGEIKILVVCVNSPDTKDTSPSWDRETIEDKISSNKHSLEAYWKACALDNDTGESKNMVLGYHTGGMERDAKKP